MNPRARQAPEKQSWELKKDQVYLKFSPTKVNQQLILYAAFCCSLVVLCKDRSQQWELRLDFYYGNRYNSGGTAALWLVLSLLQESTTLELRCIQLSELLTVSLNGIPVKNHAVWLHVK